MSFIIFFSIKSYADGPGFKLFNDIDSSGVFQSVVNENRKIDAPSSAYMIYTNDQIARGADWIDGSTAKIYFICLVKGYPQSGRVTVIYRYQDPKGIQSVTGDLSPTYHAKWDGDPHGLITFFTRYP